MKKCSSDKEDGKHYCWRQIIHEGDHKCICGEEWE